MKIAEQVYDNHCLQWNDNTIENLWQDVDYVDRLECGADLYTYLDGSQILVKAANSAEVIK